MSNIIVLAIIATSIATYLSRFLGVVSAEKMDIKSKIFIFVLISNKKQLVQKNCCFFILFIYLFYVTIAGMLKI